MLSRAILTIAVFVLMNALLLPNTFGQSPDVRTLADQPESQREAVKKILELGGDWELASKTVLIGFIGDKFTNETFSLLEPLTDLRHLAFLDIPADDSAFTHCEKLTNIEYLQISNCNFVGTGLQHFSNCKKLRVVYLDETPITDEALETLAGYPSIEWLYIDNFHIPSRITRAGVLKLSTLKNAKQIYIDMVEDPAGLKAEMKALLPDCEFYFTHRPSKREK